jgi:hypothetical protein
LKWFQPESNLRTVLTGLQRFSKPCPNPKICMTLSMKTYESTCADYLSSGILRASRISHILQERRSGNLKIRQSCVLDVRSRLNKEAVMLDKLKEYYLEKGIFALESQEPHCKHNKCCSEGYDNFSVPSPAFVGTEYQKGTLPRLLFVSANPASGLEEVSRLESLRKWQWENERKSMCYVREPRHRHSHWYKTHKLAWELLCPFYKDKFKREDLTVEQMAAYFANANSAKCSTGVTRQGPDRLFINCIEYLPQEVSILVPDIIVTQGEKARRAIEKSFCESASNPIAKLSGCSSTEINVSARKVLWIATYHPNQRGGLYAPQVQDCVPYWKSAARDFIGWASVGRDI